VQRRVDFNQGVDARILCKDRGFLRELSTICVKPLRIAFDHLGLKGPYERAVRYAHEFGLAEMSNYMLYNFHDTPADLFERMRLNVTLNEELGLRIWSFPMRYQPTDLPDRSHVGEHWTRYQLRSMQIILQATHGVVSGDPEFFRRAFGDTVDEFAALLLRPHRYIFNRDWYEKRGGRAELDAYDAAISRLHAPQKTELLDLLACEPRQIPHLERETQDRQLREVLRFYKPISKEEERLIWGFQRTAAGPPTAIPPEDELVEDAGLQDDAPVASRQTVRTVGAL
jgi:hypothetical protein